MKPTTYQMPAFAVVLLGGLILLTTATTEVEAHGMRASLAFWGAFPTHTAICQRTIAGALAYCAQRAVWLRDECSRQVLQGQICDSPATERAVEAARTQAQDAIDEFCNDDDAMSLNFLGVIEIQSDITNACRRTDSYFMPLVYAPTATANAVQKRCILATADAVSETHRAGWRAMRAAFDRIAARNLAPSKKLDLLAAAQKQVASLVNRLMTYIDSHCSAADFQSTYDKDGPTFFATVTAQVECGAGAAYVQNQVMCDPTATATFLTVPTPTPTQIS